MLLARTQRVCGHFFPNLFKNSPVLRTAIIIAWLWLEAGCQVTESAKKGSRNDNLLRLIRTPEWTIFSRSAKVGGLIKFRIMFILERPKGLLGKRTFLIRNSQLLATAQNANYPVTFPIVLFIDVSIAFDHFQHSSVINKGKV